MNSITDLVSNLQNGQIRFITFDLRTKQFKVQNTAELTFTKAAKEEKNYRCFQKIRDAASEGMDSVQVVLPGSTAVWLLEHLGYVVKHYLYYFME